MERILERMVRVLEKIEKDLSGIKDELAQVRKVQEEPHKKCIGKVTIIQKGVNEDAARQ